MLRRSFVVMLGVAITFLMASYGYAFRDDIVAAWTFDEGSGNIIHDVSGNGNDGELVGGAEWGDGRFSKALNFDGSTGYVEIPFSESMSVINAGDFTLATWFITDDVSVQRNVFQQLDGNGTGRTWLYLTSDTGCEIASYIGGGRTSSGIKAKAEHWYHVALVVTEGGGIDTVQLYVNGAPAGKSFQSGMEDADGPFRIATHKTVKNVWDGVIDDLVLISKALSEAEIKSLMDNGVAGVLDVKPSDKLAVSWGSIKSNANF